MPMTTMMASLTVKIMMMMVTAFLILKVEIIHFYCTNNNLHFIATYLEFKIFPFLCSKCILTISPNLFQMRITQILTMKMTNYNFLALLTNQAEERALSAGTSRQSFNISNFKSCCASLSELILFKSA